MSRVLWDEVPVEVKEALTERTEAKVGAVAIIDSEEGRWYFRREQFGWNNLSVDRGEVSREVASDLSPEQRAVAEKQVTYVEKLMKSGPPAEEPKRLSRADRERLKELLNRNVPGPVTETLCPTHGRHLWGMRVNPDGSCTEECACGASRGLWRTPLGNAQIAGKAAVHYEIEEVDQGAGGIFRVRAAVREVDVLEEPDYATPGAVVRVMISGVIFVGTITSTKHDPMSRKYVVKLVGTL